MGYGLHCRVITLKSKHSGWKHYRSRHKWWIPWACLLMYASPGRWICMRFFALPVAMEMASCIHANMLILISPWRWYLTGILNVCVSTYVFVCVCVYTHTRMVYKHLGEAIVQKCFFLWIVLKKNTNVSVADLLSLTSNKWISLLILWGRQDFSD